MDQVAFFNAIRKAPFPGRLGAQQLAGVKAVLAGWVKRYPDGGNQHWLAYILATAFHETGARMQPVREGFAKDDKQARRILSKKPYVKDIGGHSYYGRGLVQITWRSNYDNLGKRLGVDLVNYPDLALDLAVAVDLLIVGSVEGLYTGKKLERYFSGALADPINARRVINGLDRAADVAAYYRQFYDAISVAKLV